MGNKTIEQAIAELQAQVRQLESTDDGAAHRALGEFVANNQQVMWAHYSCTLNAQSPEYAALLRDAGLRPRQIGQLKEKIAMLEQLA